MSKPKADEFIQERDEWKKLILSLQDENNSLKKRLVSALKKPIDGKTLEKAEYFHARMVAGDEILELTRKDLEQDDKVLFQKNDDGNHINDAFKKQKDLRREMEQLRLNFKLLQDEFNKFIATSCPPC
jgi:hypothetical protein